MYWACCNISDYSEEDLQQVYAGLSPSRKARIDRLSRREDRDRSLAAERLVYDVLKKHWDFPDAKLHSGESGAPYLEGCPLYVSISHSGGKVACAVSEEPVGIDIEGIRPIRKNLCRWVCLPEELAYVFGDREPEEEICQDGEILRRFFQVWTGKEAYFKKLGTGITDLKQVNTLSLQRQLLYVIEDYFIQIL